MAEFLKKSESSRMKCGEMEDDLRLSPCKKRKVSSDLGDVECDEAESVDNSASPVASRTSGCPNHEDSGDVERKRLRSSDLENADSLCEGYETEISTSTGCVFSPEMTPTSEVNCGDSENVSLNLSSSSSPSKKKSSPSPTSFSKKIPISGGENMPSAAELEEFFAAAETIQQKQFAEKYNYDIVNDCPLEGKYEWVRFLP